MKNTKFNFRNVVDAKEPVILTITDKDVKKASLKSPSHCVMAQACMRETGHEARIHISRAYIKENGGNTWLRYVVPIHLRTEIISFDKGGSFEPGTYTLIAPRKYEKLGHEKDRPRNRKRTKTDKRTYITVKDIRTGPANGI